MPVKTYISLQGGANKPDYCTFQMSSRKFAPNNAYNTSFVTDELQMTCCLPTLVKTTDQSHAAIAGLNLVFR